MEVMRIDDYLNVDNQKHPFNSASKANNLLRKCLGEKYKNERNDISVYYTVDTSDPAKFNYAGYLQNFEKVILKHSKKIDKYHENHPECKELIFMILDETGTYFQRFDTQNQSREKTIDNSLKKSKPHLWYKDRNFIEIIKNSNADYVIWFCLNKKRNPAVCIFDVKGFRGKGKSYNPSLMFKK